MNIANLIISDIRLFLQQKTTAVRNQFIVPPTSIVCVCDEQCRKTSKLSVEQNLLCRVLLLVNDTSV